VTVEVYRHLRTGEVQHEKQQIKLTDRDSMVVFELDKGRRQEPLAAAQLAGAVKRQQALSQSVLAQQISSGSDPSALPFRPGDAASALALLGRRGAVGYMPIVIQIPDGPQFFATGVVSADRRYVRIATTPVFQTVGEVTTFTFAGRAAEPDGGGNGNGAGTGGGGGFFSVPDAVERN
jgi:hypothetical protein